MCRFTVACNLTSILAGPDGTSHRYAHQKGATAEQVAALGAAVDSYASVLATHLGKDISRLPGTGGAGGLASALYVFVNARLSYSMDIVFRELDVESLLRDQDLVITGEGMLDAKTASGKAPCALGLLAKKYDILTLAIVGSIDVDADIAFYHGLDFVASVVPRPLSIEDACDPKVARRFIVEATLRTLRSIKRCLPS
jgi:glycerate 2-kinase